MSILLRLLFFSIISSASSCGQMSGASSGGTTSGCCDAALQVPWTISITRPKAKAVKFVAAKGILIKGFVQTTDLGPKTSGVRVQVQMQPMPMILSTDGCGCITFLNAGPWLSATVKKVTRKGRASFLAKKVGQGISGVVPGTSFSIRSRASLPNADFGTVSSPTNLSSSFLVR